MALTEADLIQMMERLRSSNDTKKSLSDTWTQACKEAVKILELYESGYDKKEMGKSPDFDTLRRMVFHHLLEVKRLSDADKNKETTV